MRKRQFFACSLAVLFLLGLLSGCGNSAASDTVASETAEAYSDFAASTEAVAETPSAEMGGVVAEDSDSGNEIAPQSAADLSAKIIYSAYMDMQTTEFDSTIAAIEQAVADLGGFVESENIYGDTGYNTDGSTQIINRSAYYSVRIPAERLEEFLTQSGQLGNITNLSRDAENVTSTYTDYEAHLEALRTEQAQLTALLEKAETVEDLIALQERQSEVRYEIESIERSLKNLDLQISYSTVTINLQEVELYTATASAQRSFSQKLSDALRDGWQGFARSVQAFVVGLVSIWPIFILLAAAAAVIFVCIKKRKKQCRTKETDKAPDEAQ